MSTSAPAPAPAAAVQASVLHGARDLRLETRALAPPAADEVQVAVRATGLCGSDLHYFAHFRNGDIAVREPLTLGHESSGVVVAAGAAVAHLRPGDAVALEVGVPCAACDVCRAGRYNICRAMRFRSSAKAVPHAQGTLQERVNHPARWCHRLPDGLALELGAVAEPLSVALHARDRAAPPPAASVLVLGAGAVGLLAAAASKAAGAAAVVVADIQPDRLDFARAHGYADAAVVVPHARPASIDDKLAHAAAVADACRAATVAGRPFGEADVVYECTGVETCVQAAIYAAKPGGKVALIGMGTPVLTLPMSAAALREVDLVGVFRYANTYARALELLARPPPGTPDLSTLVTHRVAGMERVPDAFALAARVKDDDGRLVLKVVVEMPDAGGA